MPCAVGTLCILFIGARSLLAADEFPSSKWRTGSPESQGLDSAALAEAVEYVRAKRIPLHSFLDSEERRVGVRLILLALSGPGGARRCFGDEKLHLNRSRASH